MMETDLSPEEQAELAEQAAAADPLFDEEAIGQAHAQAEAQEQAELAAMEQEAAASSTGVPDPFLDEEDDEIIAPPVPVRTQPEGAQQSDGAAPPAAVSPTTTQSVPSRRTSPTALTPGELSETERARLQAAARQAGPVYARVQPPGPARSPRRVSEPGGMPGAAPVAGHAGSAGAAAVEAPALAPGGDPDAEHRWEQTHLTRMSAHRQTRSAQLEEARRHGLVGAGESLEFDVLSATAEPVSQIIRNASDNDDENDPMVALGRRMGLLYYRDEQEREDTDGGGVRSPRRLSTAGPRSRMDLVAELRAGVREEVAEGMTRWGEAAPAAPPVTEPPTTESPVVVAPEEQVIEVPATAGDDEDASGETVLDDLTDTGMTVSEDAEYPGDAAEDPASITGDTLIPTQTHVDLETVEPGIDEPDAIDPETTAPAAPTEETDVNDTEFLAHWTAMSRGTRRRMMRRLEVVAAAEFDEALDDGEADVREIQARLEETTGELDVARARIAQLEDQLQAAPEQGTGQDADTDADAADIDSDTAESDARESETAESDVTSEPEPPVAAITAEDLTPEQRQAIFDQMTAQAGTEGDADTRIG